MEVIFPVAETGGATASASEGTGLGRQQAKREERPRGLARPAS